ncbi:Crp/Fnr family transcriptional regulator [candidate division KSB1 bacterium]
MDDLNSFLSKIFLFDSMSSEQISMVANFCSIKKIVKNEHLFTEDQKATAFFAITSGRVKIYKLSPEGLEHILEIHEGGEIIAEAAIFDLETYPAYCQALEDTELVRIPKDEFIKLISHFPEISIKIMNSYSKRLRRFVSIVEELSLSNIKSRLVKYIIKNSTSVGGKRICKLNISKKELAAVLGTIPETLSRTLKHLKKEQLIDEKDNKIIILDLRELESMI